MRTLEHLYKQIGGVADFCGVKIIDSNTPGLFSTRPIHVAAIWGDCEAITMLVDSGADINKKSEHGFTPLMEAVAQGHYDAVELLIKLGAKPIPNDDGQLPSEYASILEDNRLTDLLRTNGL